MQPLLAGSFYKRHAVIPAGVPRKVILCGAARGLRLLVSTRFQVLFHSPPGVLFTFPSRYWFTIGRQGVFSLGRWSSLLPTGFPVSRGTQDPSRRAADFGYRAVTFCGRSFQIHFTCPLPFLLRTGRPATPIGKANRFGLFPFRSPLLRESLSAPTFTGTAFAFSSSGYLDVSVPLVCLLPSYGFRWRYQFFQLVGSPIRKSSDPSLLTAPRGISVFVPSFIGSWRQGIHRVPLVAYPAFLLLGDYFSR